MTTDAARRPTGLWRSIIATGLSLAVFAALTAAVLWPRNDDPQNPDAIVVLGGAGPERVQLGIQLRERYDAELVLSALAIGFGVYAGVDCRTDPDVACLNPEPRTTAGEARAIRRLVEERDWSHVTVATARFHSTRARVLLRQCLGDRVTIVGADPSPQYRRTVFDYVSEAVGTVAAATFQRAC
jgi:uncharacterized SAM-binding protein YcdF (DUF218 family)